MKVAEVRLGIFFLVLLVLLSSCEGKSQTGPVFVERDKDLSGELELIPEQKQLLEVWQTC